VGLALSELEVVALALGLVCGVDIGAANEEVLRGRRTSALRGVCSLECGLWPEPIAERDGTEINVVLCVKGK